MPEGGWCSSGFGTGHEDMLPSVPVWVSLCAPAFFCVRVHVPGVCGGFFLGGGESRQIWSVCDAGVVIFQILA